MSYTEIVKKILLWFIPHQRNNHRAKLLQPGSLLILVAIYLLNQSILKSFAQLNPGVLGYSSEITIQKVLDLTNKERAKTGLSELKYNTILSKSATAKARDMFANNYWAHNSPKGTTPWDFFKAQGYQYTVAGENLARDFYDTESVMKAWMKSPTHRANIISPKYQEIGVGVVNGTLNGVATTLVVQHFGTPLSGVLENPDNNSIAINSEPLEAPVLGNTLINPISVSKAVGSVMFVLIIGVLFIDGYIALNNKTHRFTGSNSGHIGFLAIILVLILLTRQGAVF